MSSIEKTAYPRFPKKKKIKPVELNSYSLRNDEISMMVHYIRTVCFSYPRHKLLIKILACG